MIYVQIVTTEYDPIDIAIRAKCGSWASHAEFVLEDGTTLGARMDGVKIRGCHESRSYTRIQRYTAANIAHAYEWAQSQVGKPYDYTAIMGIAFNRNWREDDSWFCSELVAAAFESIDSPLLNDDEGVEPNWISPRDLLLSTNLIRVDLGVVAPCKETS